MMNIRNNVRAFMTKAVIFDMYETLITHYNCPLYFSTEMAADAGIPVEKFQPLWRSTEYERTVGKMSFEDIITRILEENNCYSEVVLKKIADKIAKASFVDTIKPNEEKVFAK